MKSLKDNNNVALFVSQTINLYKSWDSLTPAARGQRLLSGVNTSFGHLGIPQLKVSLKVITDLGRRAEQWYRCAEFLAAGKVSTPWFTHRKSGMLVLNDVNHARLISRTLGMDWTICKHAIATSKVTSYQLVDTYMIKGWFESIYGLRANHRNATLSHMNDSAVAFRKYTHLPEERDAFLVGDKAKAQWDLKWAALNRVRVVAHTSAPLTFKEWKSQTSLCNHKRCTSLRSVDGALEAYELTPNGTTRAKLGKTFATWFIKERADYGRRNSKKAAERLKAFVSPA